MLSIKSLEKLIINLRKCHVYIPVISTITPFICLEHLRLFYVRLLLLLLIIVICCLCFSLKQFYNKICIKINVKI